MPKLSIIFSGSDMTWEDTTLFLELGAKQRHNLRDEAASHYYYIFDGVAATSSSEHAPVEKIVFDEKAVDFVKFKPRSSYYTRLDHFADLALGSGMDNVIQAAFDLIKMCVDKGITEIDLIGFSRGGSSVLAIGALIAKFQTVFPKAIVDQLAFSIYAIDPVVGLMNNQSVSRYGEISSLVKKCVVGLAVNESLPGFKPRDILSDDEDYRVKINKQTKYVFLPFPEDHLMNNLWMQDLIRRQIPGNSPLLSPCDHKMLIKRRMGLEKFKWNDDYGATTTYRMIKYVEDKQKPVSKYQRHIFPADSKLGINIKSGIEEFFKYRQSLHSKIPFEHTSIQNDSDSETKNRSYTILQDEKSIQVKISGAYPSFKKAQQFNKLRAQNRFFRVMGAKNRNVQERLPAYTNELFVNLLHEAMFQKQYPHIHRFLETWDMHDMELAITEYEKISSVAYPFTKIIIANAFKTYVHLKPIEHFKSTNIKSLAEILSITTNTVPEDEVKSFLKVEKPITNLTAYCFANILVNETQENALALYNKYSNKYFPDENSLLILIDIYKTNHKTIPDVFLGKNKHLLIKPIKKESLFSQLMMFNHYGFSQLMMPYNFNNLKLNSFLR